MIEEQTVTEAAETPDSVEKPLSKFLLICSIILTNMSLQLDLFTT